jgi:hypothetical protein
VELVEDDYLPAILANRAAAARLQAKASCERLAQSKLRLEETRRRITEGRSARQVLHESVTARLIARLQTMPIIEQAKGVIVAQTGCAPEEAFTMLRTVSQRSNVPVRELADSIVRQAAEAQPGSAPPGRPGGRLRSRSGT